jgi:2-iminobutanoate/2-iminopropanoate deaminase
MKAIHTSNAPAAIGPYSQAIEVNGFIFASGQIPIDPETGKLVSGGIREQTRQALTNAGNILKEAGTSLNRVVKTTVYLDSMDDFSAMNEVYAGFFTDPFPARSAVAVKKLPMGALVELEVLAEK